MATAVSTEATMETTVTTVATTEATTTTVVTEPEPEFATVNISAVGDNLIHSSIYKQAAARSTDGGYDFAYAYENVVPLIRDADMAIINQETLICNDKYEPSTYPRFNSPVALGDHMLEIGFDQADDLISLGKAHHFAHVHVIRDLGGRDRVVYLSNNDGAGFISFQLVLGIV